MSSPFFRRRFLIGLVVSVLALGVLAVAGLHFAARELKTRIEALLGPEATIGQILLDGTAVEIRDLRIRAPDGWPVDDSLRAERIVVEPDFRALFGGELRVGRVLAEQAYLSVLRSRDGRVRMLPSLLERPARPQTPAGSANASSETTAVLISTVELRDAAIEFFDASVRKVPHRIRIEAISADLGPLDFPALARPTSLDIAGQIKGPGRSGKLAIRGWIEIASRNSDVSTRLQGVDLRAFEPYLLKSSETGVRKGVLDLELQTRVNNRRLHAPGTLTLSQLELSGSSFMGLPRDAMLASLKNRNGEINVRFTLDGQLDDPKFSLNEHLAIRIAAGVGEALGVSVSGLARGLGNAAQGIGKGLGKLLGR